MAMKFKQKWKIPKEDLWIDEENEKMIKLIQEGNFKEREEALKLLLAKYSKLIYSAANYVKSVSPLDDKGLTVEEVAEELKMEFFITCQKYDLKKANGTPLSNRFCLRVGTYIHNNIYEDVRAKKRSVELDPSYVISSGGEHEVIDNEHFFKDKVEKKVKQSRFVYTDNILIFENLYSTHSDYTINKLSFKISYEKFLKKLTKQEEEILNMKLRGVSNTRIMARYRFKDKMFLKRIHKNMYLKAINCGLVEVK